ncbi:condensation domain-containing protein [Streptomyces sp. QH1-20]|uniref:condensation domain-containing protein n=1 Tax=Streptomyces sp. QH1-20 TaxID=3240934 RepID=UPI0035172F1F
MPGSSGLTSSAFSPGGGPDTEGTSARATSRVLPLTASQRRIWLAEQDASCARGAYQISQCVHIHGPVDTGLFRAAMRQVFAEADALRVRIVSTPDGPVQEIRPTADSAWTCIDASGETEPHGTARRWIAADMAAPITVAHGPLLRCALIALRADHWLCYLSAHQVVMDGFSLFLITRRFTQVYTRLAAGEPVGASPFGSLADLVKADLDYRASPQCAADSAYWRRTFSDPPDPAPLPARPAVANMREDDEQEGTVAGDLTPQAMCASGDRPVARPEALRQAARLAGVPRSRFICATAAVHAHQMTGAPEVVIGLVVTGRPRRALMTVPGMLNNIVPLRIKVRSGMPVAGLLTQVDRVMNQAMAHQRYPAEELARDLGLTGGIASRFSLIVNIMPVGPPLSMAGSPCTVSGVALNASRPARMGLLALDRRDGAGLRLETQAARERHCRADLVEHQQRLLLLLDAMTMAAPDRHVGALDPRAVDERRRLPESGTGYRALP